MVETNKAPVRAMPGLAGWRPVPSAAAEAFFRTAYRKLVTIAMYVGATKEEAEDAADSVMVDVLQRWEQIGDPLAYARRAVVSNHIKERTRSRQLVRRLTDSGEAKRDHDHEFGQNARLTLWEDSQWVTQLLSSLPPAQREVMAYIVDEFTPTEVARLLGKDAAAVRQNLHAARQRLAPAVPGQLRRPSSSPREEAR